MFLPVTYDERTTDKRTSDGRPVEQSEALGPLTEQPRQAPQQENHTPGAAPAPLDAVVVAQAKQDPSAFGVIYERYVDRIYSYVYHRVHNQQDAEDLTAQIFFQALAKLYTYEDRGLPFSAWLFRIAHNLVANWHRDNSRRKFVALDGLSLAGRRRQEPDAVVEQEEEHEALWEAIERLPAERRDLLLYKFGSRLSNLEIGKLMNRSEGAIKSLYFRTLAALRKDLSNLHRGKDTSDDEVER